MMIQAEIVTMAGRKLVKETWFKLLPVVYHDVVIGDRSYKIMRVAHLIEPHHSLHLTVMEN